MHRFRSVQLGRRPGGGESYRWRRSPDRPRVTPTTASTSAAQRGERAGGDRLAGPGHQVQRPGDVVQADQAGGGRLADGEQVAEVAPAVAGAHGAGAVARRAGSSSPPWRAALTCSRPAPVSAVPWRPRRVCITQSNWSTPSGDGLDERRRVADAHQVARAVGGQVRRWSRRAPAASRRASRRPTARRCRSRRSRARRCAGRSPPRSDSSVPPWTMPNSDWSSRRWAARARAGPRRGALDGELDDAGRARQRRAHVEHHLDVGAEQLLGGHRRLRREAVQSSRRRRCGT